MTDYFAKLGFEKFTNNVADKVIERIADKIVESVVERIKPMLSQNTNAPSRLIPFQILRKEAPQYFLYLSRLFEKMYSDGGIKYMIQVPDGCGSEVPN